MSFQFNSIFRAAALVIFCGLLAACQTSGLKPGSLNTSFAPKGWVSQKSGNKAVYVCLPSVCKTPQIVVVGPAKVRGDVEAAIREDILSAELMNAVDNLVNVAAKGQVRFKTDRRVVTKTYTGFDLSARFKTKSGYDYGAARLIFQDNRGSVVASFAKSRSTAKTNLRRFFQQTTVRRVP
ncbi:hypothetical protein [Roseibium sediminicola]|uniref:Lipoprotein n=1 Tax=Roseibium sediminicola TaxID=2933272 RepID=A0ABT0H2H2_9HYPH|nr:hypothetical protein [Roseibium sp. CAU 1639]MCK7615675.1 hypothetical protein [Roseibium sp. CAU 1639]